jgi:hypothetical protein
MGKAQSKLTPEQLVDLQKDTYCQYFQNIFASHNSGDLCSRQEGNPAMAQGLQERLPFRPPRQA